MGIPFVRTPEAHEACAACKHIFSRHYTTYDDTKTGCSHITPGGGDQRDSWPSTTCLCLGFAMRYKHQPTPVRTDYDGPYDR